MANKDMTLPWDAHDKVVTEDNVYASQLRYDAIKAIKNRTATPEQHELIRETDRVMAEAVQLYREGKQ